MNMTVFDMVFAVSDALITFSSAFWNFISTPLGEIITPFSVFKNVPFIGDFYMDIMSSIYPLSPLDILAGGGLTIIMILVIIKKLVPVA